MDANATRFELILGRADWARCFEVEPASGDVTRLGDYWNDRPTREAVGLGWDSERSELTLRKEMTIFAASPSDRRVVESDRRAAGADAFGNLYWIGPDGRSIYTRGVERRGERIFWPRPLAEVAATAGEFRPSASGAAETMLELRGLVVTDDLYLVVGTRSPAGALWFDLVGGGAPRDFWFPPGLLVGPEDLSRRKGGGFFLLDRPNRRIWEFDRHFRNVAPVGVSLLEELGSFRSETKTAPKCVPEQSWQAVDAMAIPATDPFALDTLSDGSVVVLDRPPGQSTPRLYRHDQTGWIEIPGLDVLTAAVPLGFNRRTHEFAVLRGTSDTDLDRLVLIPEAGNQAFLFVLEHLEGFWFARMRAEFLPLRLYSGKGIAVRGRDALYDSSGNWVPIRSQERPRHAREGWIQTDPYDSKLPECVWHRLMLDGCIPAEGQVEVDARAANSLDDLGTAEWQVQPSPYRRWTGSELPWLSVEASGGRDTWELLLQKVRGRFVELRFRLSGNGRVTPRLRAVRLYAPRFSYVRNYLPEIYRDEDLFGAAGGSADFYDRFVANFEGQFTALEDRMANLQVLLDPRLAPPETLAWLAEWLGAVLDPAWDVPRQRLFLRHAMELYRWRGTQRGLELALQLALDPCVSEAGLRTWVRPASSRPFRIVEHFTRRRPIGVAQVIAAVTPGCPPLKTTRWLPGDGADELHQRYRQALSSTDSALRFPVRRPTTGDSGWAQFCRDQLGFLPMAGQSDTDQWRQFLAGRYLKIQLLNDVHSAEWAEFTAIALPVRLPESGPLREDWEAFSAEARGPSAAQEALLWQEFLHRRYRTVRHLAEAYANAASFEAVVLPAELPNDVGPLQDWYDFEGVVLAMQATAHRFTVLLPARAGGGVSVAETQRSRLALADRLIRLEKPAHTVYDVQFFWAYFRVGQARLGEDTALGRSSRLPELLGPFVLGESPLARGYLSAPELPVGRLRVTDQARPYRA